jgi:hypothetical protein
MLQNRIFTIDNLIKKRLDAAKYVSPIQTRARNGTIPIHTTVRSMVIHEFSENTAFTQEFTDGRYSEVILNQQGEKM